ncbi:MAG: sulfatase [Planctomycetota bacterium]
MSFLARPPLTVTARWLAALAFATLALSCGGEEDEPPSLPVDRLVLRLEEAEVSSVLAQPEQLPQPARRADLLLERFEDTHLTSWQEADLAKQTLAPVSPGACERDGEWATFPQKDRYLFCVLPIPPGVVLTLEASLRLPPTADPADPPLFLNEYRGPEVFQSFSTLLRAKKQARLVPSRIEGSTDPQGFITYRLVWRTGPTSRTLALALAPGTAGEGDGLLAAREIRIRRAPPRDLLRWCDGSDPPVDGARGEKNGRYFVRVELDRRRADALFAPPPTRFRFAVPKNTAPRRLLCAFAIPAAQATGEEGPVTCRVTAETPEGAEPVATRTVTPDPNGSPVAWVEIDAPLPTLTSLLVLETLREATDPRGLVPVYLIDPILVTQAPATAPPNMILVSLDTLRADHLSAYGYNRPTSPFLEELARRGVLFEDASSPAAYTLPSHVTMLSGQFPTVHSVEEVWDHIEKPRTRLLSETLRDHGYRTAAFAGGMLVHSSYGFEHGFDRYSDRDPLIHDDLTAVLHWIDSSRHSPFFLFVHTYGIHDFVTTPELAAQFHEPGTSRLEGHSYPEWGVVDVREGATAEDRRYVTDLYDAAVAHADAFVRKIAEHLDQLGLAERSLFIVTSDHGKELLDRGVLAHGHSLYSEITRVPLIMCGPGILPRRVRDPVSVADIAPTLLDELGFDIPEEVQGRSLLPFLRGGSQPPRPVFAETVRPPFHKYALRDSSLTLVRNDLIEGSDWLGEKARELYDRQRDPAERSDLYGTQRGSSELDKYLEDLVQGLRRVRSVLDQRPRPGEPKALREDVLESLKQAGYVR